MDEDEVTEGINAGLDAGVNHFDNADVYGNGRVKRMLARVLDRLGVNRNGVVIATVLAMPRVACVLPGVRNERLSPA